MFSPSEFERIVEGLETKRTLTFEPFALRPGEAYVFHVDVRDELSGLEGSAQVDVAVAFSRLKPVIIGGNIEVGSAQTLRLNGD
jgi:hypothetical protein